MVPLKLLSNFRRTLEINLEVNLQLTWSRYHTGTVANKEPKFKITDTNFYIFIFWS